MLNYLPLLKQENSSSIITKFLILFKENTTKYPNENY